MEGPAGLFSLSGRIACVTGASSGLGRRAASVLAEAGAAVVGVARRGDALEDWAEQPGGRRVALSCDLGDEAAIEPFCEAVCELFGTPDILVHAAGVNPRKAADEVTREDWRMTQWLNLSVPFFICQRLVPQMKVKGWGRIVHFASLQTTRAFPAGIAYGTSKGGVGQMTRAMAAPMSGRLTRGRRLSSISIKAAPRRRSFCRCPDPFDIRMEIVPLLTWGADRVCGPSRLNSAFFI